jgi:hypothetical protein
MGSRQPPVGFSHFPQTIKNYPVLRDFIESKGRASQR